MKKLMISATLIAVALGSGAILAAQGERSEGPMHQPGSPMPQYHGQHAGGHGHMAQMHARMGEHMAQLGEHGRGRNAEHAGRGPSTENCPMFEQKSGS